MKALLIAEKPSLRKEIETVYDSIKSKVPYDITFTEQRGHLVTTMLPDEISETMKSWTWDTIPFHPESFGGFRYKVIKEKKTGRFLTSQERFRYIADEIASGKYDAIINAGDPDQEGELLIRTVLQEAGNTLPVLRFWTNDLTPKAIEKALLSLRDDDHDTMLCQLYAAALLEGKTVTLQMKKDDREWSQAVRYDAEGCRLDFLKKDSAEKESAYKCICCGSTLLENDYLYRCPSCEKMQVWKSVGKGENRYILKESELKQLLTVHITPKLRLKSDKGQFEAQLALTAEGVKYIFPQKRRRK